MFVFHGALIPLKALILASRWERPPKLLLLAAAAGLKRGRYGTKGIDFLGLVFKGGLKKKRAFNGRMPCQRALTASPQNACIKQGLAE